MLTLFPSRGDGSGHGTESTERAARMTRQCTTCDRPSYHRGVTDFDLYELPDEYHALRSAIREIAEERIAPNAAEADETSQFPEASHEALRQTDCTAPQLPA